MLEKLFRYVNGLAVPTIREIGGQTYSDKPLTRIHHNPRAERIKLSSLSSLVQYLKSNVDLDPASATLFIHVESPRRVTVFSPLDDERGRESLVVVEARLPSFDFGTFLEHERFCIGLQSKFVDTYDRALLLKFAGTVESGSIAEYGDDGVSQKATIKTGIASKDEAIVPNPVILMPWRTFHEVEQPASPFVFRMKEDRGGISCALFEADGGAWELDAVRRVSVYLREALADCPGMIVLD
jgi:hypothetical protein